MKKLLLALTLAFSPAVLAEADCYGSDTFKTCYDYNSGNEYTIQKYGNSTYMEGSNSQTGSEWSQESHTYGGTTIHEGTDKDGNSWSTTCFNGVCY
ncbi:hypothetical protein [Vibrio nigripulchritudo]|uniref:hypothetical protein n=1 Tax=Vibrio nigripulchritudo TaxID=28173 RepID=UPI0003B1E49C